MSDVQAHKEDIQADVDKSYQRTISDFDSSSGRSCRNSSATQSTEAQTPQDLPTFTIDTPSECGRSLYSSSIQSYEAPTQVSFPSSPPSSPQTANDIFLPSRPRPATKEELFTFLSLRFLQEFHTNRSMKYLQRCTQDMAHFSKLHLFTYADPTGLARFLIHSKDIISGAKEDFTNAHAAGVLVVLELAQRKYELHVTRSLSVEDVKAIKSSLERCGLGWEVSKFVEFLTGALIFEAENYKNVVDQDDTKEEMMKDPFHNEDWLDRVLPKLHQTHHNAADLISATEVFRKMAEVMVEIEQREEWCVKIDCANPSDPKFAGILRKLSEQEQIIVLNAINSDEPDAAVEELEQKMGILAKIGLAMRADLLGV